MGRPLKTLKQSTAIFDTNIVIDLFNGVDQARVEIESYRVRAISIVTWIEVMAGVQGQEAKAAREALDDFMVIALTQKIAERAASERRTRRLKLPDTIILATALVAGGVLVTRNTRDFQEQPSVVRIPYQLGI
jgi:predicted nucleic acid-binding protein